MAKQKAATNSRNEEADTVTIEVDFDDKTTKPYFAGLSERFTQPSSAFYITAVNNDFLSTLERKKEAKPKEKADASQPVRRKDKPSEWETKEVQQRKKRKLMDFVRDQSDISQWLSLRSDLNS